MNKSIKKIVPGPFVDNLVADYLKIKRKKWSTNAKTALELLSKFVDETPSGFTISYRKQLNSQICKVTLNRRGMDYEAVDGYLPMAICLLFINSWAKNLRYYNFEFLKMKWELYKELQYKLDEGEIGYDTLTDEENDILNFHPDLPAIMRLSDDQIRALVEYANQ